MELKKEEKLLVECLAENTDLSMFDDVTDDEWEKIVRLSVECSVAPLVYRHIKKSGMASDLSSHVFDKFRRLYQISMEKSVLKYNEIAKVLKLLDNNEIPVIVLKGPHLGEIVYNNIAVRTMTDVDLLFREENLANAQEVLEKNENLYDNSQLHLDIHLDFDRDIETDMEAVWKRAVPGKIAGRDVLVLSPEDLLLHLCVHLSFRHMFKELGLRPLCDIKETVNRYQSEMDWEKFIQLCKRWKVGKPVYLSLLLVSELLRADIPDFVLNGLKTEMPDRMLKAWALEYIFTEEDKVFLSRYFWNFLGNGSVRDKLRDLRELLLPSPQYISHQYNVGYGSIKNYVFYLTRVLKYFSRYARAAWKLLIRDERMLSIAEREKRNATIRKWLLSSER